MPANRGSHLNTRHSPGRGIVPKNMRMHVTLDPGTVSGMRAQVSDALAAHGMVRALLRAKQPLLRFAPAPINT